MYQQYNTHLHIPDVLQTIQFPPSPSLPMGKCSPKVPVGGGLR